MGRPGQYVLLNRVQSASKNIDKTKKLKNKKLKKKIEKTGKEFVKNKNEHEIQAQKIAPERQNKQQKKSKNKQNKQKPNVKQEAPVNPKQKKEIQPKIQSETKRDFHEDLADRLKASRFRFINEQLYTHTGDEAHDIFNQDDSAFRTYHEGYRKQVEQWPLNPLDRIINSIKKL